jgi:hypothetical protein
MHKLPIGIQDFPKIRENGYIYVDKTELAYNLITTQSNYFLSRPRRFGKSLLCSTLANIWSGKKEFFNGLWIENSDWKWDEHPVIRIDLNIGDYNTGSGELKSLLIKTLRNIAEDYKVSIDDDADTVSLMFSNLIRKLDQKYNKK